MSILIIDSEPGSEIRLKTVFDEYGFDHVDIVKSAEQAKQFIKEKEDAVGIDEITLIVINSELEDGDGYELSREINKTKAGEKAYIIILISSIENKSAITKAKQSKADDIAVKPYESAGFIKPLMMFAHKKSVLLIEDDPVIRQLVMSLLFKKHVELIVITDGLKAYNMINSIAPPKLVLLDIGLPGMSGLKLVSHMRKKQLWRKTPILMLTGSTDSGDVKESLTSGANDYIVKPFQINDFISRTDKYFEDS
jgi:DNA-binding response OmpR family regulator